MIRLISTTMKLQVVLGGAITTNQLHCSVGYYDVPNQEKVDTSEYRGSMQQASTNSTTDVDICAAPTTAGTVRKIDYIAIYNRDTVNATVTVKTDDGGTEYIQVTETLATTESLVYTPESGWMKF